MLLYMYHNCNYLFLNNAQRDTSLTIGQWTNLPVLSAQARECYLTIVDCKLILASAGSKDSINVKMNIPSRNYWSSSNSSPIVAMLHTEDNKVFDLVHENAVHILTSDALSKVQIQLEDNVGAVFALPSTASLEIMIKIEYLDQEKQTESYLSEIPKLL